MIEYLNISFYRYKMQISKIDSTLFFVTLNGIFFLIFQNRQKKLSEGLCGTQVNTIKETLIVVFWIDLSHNYSQLCLVTVEYQKDTEYYSKNLLCFWDLIFVWM